MLDCSAEILTQENLGEQCDPDKICDLVFEQLEIKKRSWRKRFIAIIAIACILCGCVGAGILLGPGGKITDQVTFESEVGQIEKEPGKNNTTSIESNFIEDQFYMMTMEVQLQNIYLRLIRILIRNSCI